jgi:hypothetical protein
MARVPDMDHSVNRIPDVNYANEYDRGYEEALHKLQSIFEKEYYQSFPEDPHYAYYAKHVLNVIRKEINPLLGTDD